MYLTPDQANLPKGVCIADGCDLRVAGRCRSGSAEVLSPLPARDRPRGHQPTASSGNRRRLTVGILHRTYGPANRTTTDHAAPMQARKGR